MLLLPCERYFCSLHYRSLQKTSAHIYTFNIKFLKHVNDWFLDWNFYRFCNEVEVKIDYNICRFWQTLASTLSFVIQNWAKRRRGNQSTYAIQNLEGFSLCLIHCYCMAIRDSCNRASIMRLFRERENDIPYLYLCWTKSTTNTITTTTKLHAFFHVSAYELALLWVFAFYIIYHVPIEMLWVERLREEDD